MTTPVVAEPISLLATWAGVRVRCCPSSTAAAPATCGVAIDVPDRVLVAVGLVYQSETICEPGAKVSTQVPKLEYDARASVRSVAATVRAAAARAGDWVQALTLSLPAATRPTRRR